MAIFVPSSLLVSKNIPELGEGVLGLVGFIGPDNCSVVILNSFKDSVLSEACTYYAVLNEDKAMEDWSLLKTGVDCLIDVAEGTGAEALCRIGFTYEAALFTGTHCPVIVPFKDTMFDIEYQLPFEPETSVLKPGMICCSVKNTRNVLVIVVATERFGIGYSLRHAEYVRFNTSFVLPLPYTLDISKLEVVSGLLPISSNGHFRVGNGKLLKMQPTRIVECLPFWLEPSLVGLTKMEFKVLGISASTGNYHKCDVSIEGTPEGSLHVSIVNTNKQSYTFTCTDWAEVAVKLGDEFSAISVEYYEGIEGRYPVFSSSHQFLEEI